MSRTTIYRLGRDPGELGECRNAWRGAMYVWNDVARRYFGLDGFPIFSQAQQSRVWNAHLEALMPTHEVIVLLSTMDKGVIRGEDAEGVAAAFDRYAVAHPNSSLGEQAAILRSGELRPGDFAAWRQTSVSEFWGGEAQATDDGEWQWYDPTTGTGHFDVYAEALAHPTTQGGREP